MEAGTDQLPPPEGGTGSDAGYHARAYVALYDPAANSGAGAVTETDELGDSLGTDQFHPAVAISPNGAHLFVGFYSQTGGMIDSYAVTSQTLDTGVPDAAITWNSPQRLTSTSFAPPAADVPTGYEAGRDAGFLGDYDQATADDTNFYYPFAQTHSATIALPGGGTASGAQSDIYLATIPIPYTSAAPAVPTTPQYNPETNTLTWDAWRYSGLSPMPTVYAEYSTPGSGWVTLGSAAASAGSIALGDFGYVRGRTYYFRLRAQYGTGSDAPPAYSPVIQAWTGWQPDLADAWFVTAGQFPDPNVQNVVHYTYGIHLDLSWDGAPQSNTSAELQYLAPGS